ncbi:hypothetical protein ACMGDM_15765 [Sphingomonas sp. DT-51]|uniref:hypothetical protein n=1 Tax=Sphingomonas sp. DT-51 TaxID=3396165 RepID=UPI003F197826
MRDQRSGGAGTRARAARGGDAASLAAPSATAAGVGGGDIAGAGARAGEVAADGAPSGRGATLSPAADDIAPPISATVIAGPRAAARLDAAARARFLDQLAMLGCPARAAAAIGVAPVAAYALRRRSARFAVAWREALAIGYERLEAETLRRLLDGAVLDLAGALALLDRHRAAPATPAASATASPAPRRATRGRAALSPAGAELVRRLQLHAGVATGVRRTPVSAAAAREVDALEQAAARAWDGESADAPAVPTPLAHPVEHAGARCRADSPRDHALAAGDDARDLTPAARGQGSVGDGADGTRAWLDETDPAAVTALPPNVVADGNTDGGTDGLPTQEHGRACRADDPDTARIAHASAGIAASLSVGGSPAGTLADPAWPAPAPAPAAARCADGVAPGSADAVSFDERGADRDARAGAAAGRASTQALGDGGAPVATPGHAARREAARAGAMPSEEDLRDPVDHFAASVWGAGAGRAAPDRPRDLPLTDAPRADRCDPPPGLPPLRPAIARQPRVWA